MELTAQQVYDAAPLVAKIIRENRPLPQKGGYRMMRMHVALTAEYNTISARRDALIVPYDHKVKIKDDNGEEQEVPAVPADKMPEFLAKWKEIAEEKIEVSVQPIPLAQLDLGNDVVGSITPYELYILGNLVSDTD